MVEPSAKPDQPVQGTLSDPSSVSDPGSSSDPSSSSDPTDDEPVLPRVTRDEAAGGWGERPDDDRSDDWYLRERPPHHEG